ncbi:MAG: ABC transporter substrate-binding protein [Thaumarchaeota archaeon]|nr:ABC transporter substrate-binding protein [Nitrososphaerota archaeon]
MPLERSLRVIVFKGASCLPLFVADEQGYFKRQRLDVGIIYTASSTEQMQGLLMGRWDIASTAADNVIAWSMGQGADGKEHPEIIIVMGGDKGALYLYVSPSIEGISDLRGRVLGVDSPQTGFALVLMKILASNGLSRSDYQLKVIGATNLRLQKLLVGEIDGTLLTPPHSHEAASRGFKLLADKDDYLPHYLSGALAVTKHWAKEHSGVLIEYIKAYISALEWIFTPTNRTQAVEILSRRLEISVDAASTAYMRFVDAKSGSTPKGQISLEGLHHVAALRAEMTGKPFPSLERFYDLSYHNKALANVV